MRTGPESVLRLIAFAMGLGIVAMAGLELQRALDSEAADWPAVLVTDPHRETLRECRVLKLDVFEAEEDCKAAWAENRRRFFGIDAERSEAD